MNTVRVLLVEDNVGDILLTTEALDEGHLKCTLPVVCDDWRAIQCPEKKGDYTSVQKPDLSILDINMPKLNGHRVLSQIMHSGFLKQIAVILLSTSSDEQDPTKSYNHYTNCYITKPVAIHSFFDVISALINFGVHQAKLPVNANTSGNAP